MKVEISLNQFISTFEDYGRGDSFSYEGFKALFEYLEECGTDNVDPIGIDCEFAEYESLEAFNADTGADMDSIRQLERETLVLPLGRDPENDGFVAAHY